MADIERVRQDIKDIANRPKAVRFEEIERIVNQLEALGHSVKSRTTKGGHSWIFRVDDQLFSISTHNPGSSQIKVAYVKAFLEAMINLGLYED